MKERKIVDYRILINESYSEQILEVQGALDDGWQPFGPCQYCETVGDEFYTQYTQTMVKYED